ncbi:sterol desaturase family protein [Pseudoalteromonas sp. NEC-BIFX-2020_015]|uniref:sterol desaturase family protein n=1 Tax=Pseudoalteromonas sp. NEC-BIFX-2020_015 TaxID=2729544 RepID=UPI0014613B04|nr:sterol desaturase family protein [Pseudoalteromonas sp. NEC-BIFX-2020_015]NMR25978.1 sterol desaturase family protein [Pseudoalteromonas sp. NEC-BIFX-2020_015]
MTNEALWRLGAFLTILTVMMIVEAMSPARTSPVAARKRWFANFSLVVLASVLARLTIPIGLTSVALYCQQHTIGVFNQFTLPLWLAVVLSLLLLDIVIYWQHRLFHKVPLLWRLHRVHHVDPHVDTSTGLRFHPLEIILSIIIKLIIVVLLGVPALAVLIFEIALNGLALFNHANISLPNKVERVLRYVLITQQLHRIHHSQTVTETNSNFGFSVTWWDRLFGSYTPYAKLSDDTLNIGLKEFSTSNSHSRLVSLIVMPFKK